MRVLLAEEMGMCFGVRDALAALDEIAQPDAVTIHGQLVHNEVVLERLGRRGFHMEDEADRSEIPATRTVLVTAHGISDRERSRLESAGRTLIDTTCPLVRRVHEAALRMQSQGCHVIVIGRANHVEVRGIVEDLRHFDVVESPAQARSYPAHKLAIVSQTTVAPRTVAAVHRAIVAANPEAEIHFVDTTCQPTRNRQRAVEKLLPFVQAMVVIGGRNSNNTRELADLCRERGVRTFQACNAGDLRTEWFRGLHTVGLTAGTSTLDETIHEAAEWLHRFQPEKPFAQRCISHRWQDYFKSNVGKLLPIPWGSGAALSPEEKAVLIPSLQDFQLGESSDGKHGLSLAAQYGDRVGDPGYVEAMRLFFAEEGRHAAALKRYLELAGAVTIERSWTDFFFRRIRRLLGLETMITVLLSAELIGKVYYRAIHAASRCPVLRGVCAQLLRDEKMHLRFHIERLRIMCTKRSRVRRRCGLALHRCVYFGACLAVWWRHGRAIRRGEFGFRKFWREAWKEWRNALEGISGKTNQDCCAKAG